MVKVNQRLFLDFNIDMTKCLTISKLAYEIFNKDYYMENDNPIPLINKKNIYNDIKLGYYGGMTEVYKPYGENLYYYDVNSLYPYVSLNDMPGLECSKLEYINTNKSIDELFGFFYCDIEVCENKYLGILPVKIDTGNIYPVGKWSGMYFSEELKFAQENGYKINVKWGYKFNRAQDVFKKYVENIYKMKSNPSNVTQKLLAKSLLNNLLGRFGMDFNKYNTDIVDMETYNKIIITREVTSIKVITDNYMLITYSPYLDKSICEEFNIDYNQALKDPKIAFVKNKSSSYDNVSIAISAAITAYGRIHINKIKNIILQKGGNIYYSDTDSIVTNVKLTSKLVDRNSIGKLKLECKIKKGYFISGKTYCLILDKKYVTKENKGVIIKNKGFDDDGLNEIDFKNMYKGIDVKALKTTSNIDYSKGSVVINKKPATLSADNYVTRNKIYVNKVWKNTKPVSIGIDTLEKDKTDKKKVKEKKREKKKH